MNAKSYFLAFAFIMIYHFVAGQGETILAVAQEMPALPACAQEQDFGRRRDCTDAHIATLLAKHLKYPAQAKQAGAEARVLVRFVVTEKGKATDLQVEEDPGYGMAAAAIKAVKKFGKWVPGRNMGKPVKVRMSVPVRFDLPPAPEPYVAPPDIYVHAEQMPRYESCNLPDDLEARNCTLGAVSSYMRQHLVYPEEAQKQNVSGTVITSFVIDETGAIKDAVVERGLGAGCDEEALRLLRAMPKWVPGREGGKAVKVRMTLPVQFTIPVEKE